jgi:hypothetical protein
MMADELIKKRLRNAERKITATLSLAGYDVYPLGAGPFHLCADGRDGGKRIRIVFGDASADDTRPMSRAVMPPNCYREIWQVSDDGKRFVIVQVAASRKS